MPWGESPDGLEEKMQSAERQPQECRAMGREGVPKGRGNRGLRPMGISCNLWTAPQPGAKLMN